MHMIWHNDEANALSLHPQGGPGCLFRGGKHARLIQSAAYLLFNPANWHPDRSVLQIPACRTPSPIDSPLHQPCALWIQVDVFEFLLDLGRRMDVKTVGLRLPELIPRFEVLKVAR